MDKIIEFVSENLALSIISTIVFIAFGVYIVYYIKNYYRQICVKIIKIYPHKRDMMLVELENGRKQFLLSFTHSDDLTPGDTVSLSVVGHRLRSIKKEK